MSNADDADEVFEDFVKAEELYSMERRVVIAELEQLAARQLSIGRAAEIAQMHKRLESASTRLMNAAMDLTRASLLAARDASVLTGRLDYITSEGRPESPVEIVTAESLTAAVAEAKEELTSMKELAVYIESTVRELNELKARSEELDISRSALEESVALLRSKESPTEQLLRRIQATKVSMKQRTQSLEHANEERVRLEHEYESTRQERERNLAEQAVMGGSIKQLEIQVSSMDDQIFLKEADNERRLEKLNTYLHLRESLESDIKEVERFPVDPLEDNADLRDRFSAELASLEAEKVRLTAEIEQVRERQFRRRVKY